MKISGSPFAGNDQIYCQVIGFMPEVARLANCLDKQIKSLRVREWIWLSCRMIWGGVFERTIYKIQMEDETQLIDVIH